MKKTILISLLVFLLSLFFVYADELTCTLLAPTTGSSVGNLSVFNLSFAGGTNNATVTGYFNASSASTRNSSAGTLLWSLANLTAIHTLNGSINITINKSMIFEDSDDVVVEAAVETSVGRVDCGSTATGVLVDRTMPAPPTGITYTNPLVVDNTITATINRELANQCFIRFGSSNAPRKAMALSSSTCTFTVARDNPPNSDYQTFISASDRTNETLSTVQNVVIRAVTSDGGGVLGGTLVKTPSGVSAQSVFPTLDAKNKQVLAIVLLLLAFLYFKNKK